MHGGLPRRAEAPHPVCAGIDDGRPARLRSSQGTRLLRRARHARRMAPITVPGAPYKLSATPWAIRRPAPGLGEHTAEVLRRSGGDSKAELAELRGRACHLKLFRARYPYYVRFGHRRMSGYVFEHVRARATGAGIWVDHDLTAGRHSRRRFHLGVGGAVLHVAARPPRRRGDPRRERRRAPASRACCRRSPTASRARTAAATSTSTTRASSAWRSTSSSPRRSRWRRT